MGLPEGTKPKNSAEKYGILNPKQQRLLGFNQGFIPNFKNPKTISSDQLVGQINTLSSVKNIPIDESDPNNSKMRLDSLKNSVQGLRELKAAISISDDFSGKDYVKDKIEEEFKSLSDARSAGMPDMRWTGYIPNFAKGRSAKQPKKGSGEGLDTAPAQSALNKFQDKALLASLKDLNLLIPSPAVPLGSSLLLITASPYGFKRFFNLLSFTNLI